MLEEYLGEQNWCFADCSKRNCAARAIGTGSLCDLDALFTLCFDIFCKNNDRLNSLNVFCGVADMLSFKHMYFS